MPRRKNFKKKPDALKFRTPDKFKRTNFKRNFQITAMTARPRCLGGHH